MKNKKISEILFKEIVRTIKNEVKEIEGKIPDDKRAIDILRMLFDQMEEAFNATVRQN